MGRREQRQKNCYLELATVTLNALLLFNQSNTSAQFLRKRSESEQGLGARDRAGEAEGAEVQRRTRE
jgi:hypothetical protein